MRYELTLDNGIISISPLLTDEDGVLCVVERCVAHPQTDYYSSSFKTDKNPHTFYYK